MTRQKVQGVALAAAVAAAAMACTNTSTTEGPQPTVVDSLPPPGTDDDASPSPNEDAESPAAGSTAETDASAANDEESGAEPDEDPTPIPASSEGPAQNWPVPEPPEQIYEPTEEGAEALIQYWFDVRHYARITGDTEPLEHVSLDGCVICEAELEVVEEVFSNGGWFVGEPDIVGDKIVRLESERSATGRFELSESEFESFWDGESHGLTEEGSPGEFGVAMMYEDESWMLLETSFIDRYESSGLVDSLHTLANSLSIDRDRIAERLGGGLL